MEQLTGKDAQGFVKKFEGVFTGLPHLPKGIVDFIVSISPWLAGIGGLGSVFGGINSLFWTGSSNVWWQMAKAYSGMSGMYFKVIAIISILTGILLLMAFNPLKNRKLSGWMYIFWSNMLGLVSMVLSIVFGYGGFVSSLVGAAIGFYVLFEVKKSYK